MNLRSLLLALVVLLSSFASAADKYTSKEFGFRVAFPPLATVEITKNDRGADFSTDEEKPWQQDFVDVVSTDFKQVSDIDATITAIIKQFGSRNMRVIAELPKGIQWGTTKDGFRYGQANLHMYVNDEKNHENLVLDVTFRTIAVPAKNKFFSLSAMSEEDVKTDKQGFLDSFEIVP